MTLIKIDSEKQKNEFCNFVYDVYKDNPNYKDHFNHNIKYFLWKKGDFARHCRLFPMAVYKQQRIVARCLFIHHPDLNALQMGFFEALPEQQMAVDALLIEAEILALELNLKRILIGLNGHLAYGVGFLANSYDRPNSFDGLYSQPYYLDYFRQHGLIEHPLSTYKYQSSTAHFSEQSLHKVYEHFTFRNFNLQKFSEEMDILGRLFNETLASTRFYFCLSKEEYNELIKPLAPILSEGNIIFASHKGKEIGFIFWHPDYHQLLKAGKNRIALFLIKYYLQKKTITDFKINAIGVLPEYWSLGVATGLVNEVHQRTKNRYLGGETSFIWDDNHQSVQATTHFTGKPFKRYMLFEKNMMKNQNNIDKMNKGQ